MKKASFILRLFLMISLVAPIIICPNIASAEQSVDKVVAIVNNEIITQSELTKAVNSAKKEIQEMHAPMPANTDTLRKQVLDDLIDRKLQMQIANTANITTNNDEINKVIQSVVNTNHLSFERFKQELAKRGLTFDSYKNKIRDEIIIRKLQHDALGKKVVLNPQDVDSALKSARVKLAEQKAATQNVTREYRIVDFLAPLQENSTPDQVKAAQNKIKTLIAQLTKTSNFEQFFKENHGVDLGWRKTSDLPDIFAKIVTKLKPKETAGPIAAPNGFHAIVLIDTKGGPSLPQEITKDQAENFAYQQKFGEELKKWIDELRSRAYIKIFDEQN